MSLRTAVNVLTNWAAFVAGTVISFVLTPFVVHSLGDVRYGLWGVIGSIVGYLGLLDLGVRVGVTRFVARYHATGEQTEVNKIVTTAFGIFSMLGAAAMVLGVALALLLPHLTQVPPSLVTEGGIALAISGVTVAAALLGGVFGGSLAGIQRFAAMNVIDLSVEGCRALLVVVILRAGGGLVGLSLVQLGAVTVRGLLYVVVNRHFLPGLRLARALWDSQALRQIASFSGFAVILHVSGIVILGSDAVVIAAILPITQVTFFVIAGNLAQAVAQVQGGITRAVYPMVSARQATEGTHGAGRLVRDTIRLATVLVLPIPITLFLRGATFIALWMGPSYRVPTGHVMEILALGLCVGGVGYPVLVSNVMALNLHRRLVLPFVLEAAVNLGLSVVLCYVMGINGVAWGTVLPRTFMALGFAPWFAKRHLGLGMRDYSLHAWVRPLAAMIPFVIATVLVDEYWAVSGLVLYFTQIVILLPLAAAGGWMVGLDRAERERLKDGFKRLLTRLGAAPRRPLEES